MLYTAAPSTCPVGSKPTLRIAVNSSVDRADPQVPLCRSSAIRAAAAGGRPDRRGSSVTAHLSRGAPTIPGTAGADVQAGPDPVSAVAVLGVPLPVALLGQVPGAAGFLPGRERPQPVLAPGRPVVVLHGVAGEAVPEVLARVVAHGH